MEEMKLGDTCHDKVSGFTGTITGITEYLDDIRRVEITATTTQDGDIKSEWFAWTRCAEGPSEKRF